MKIFLDHNSTTPLLTCAYEAMKPYFTSLFYNPGGIQDSCQEINSEIEKSRLSICKLISQKNKGKFCFTSSATEANNFVMSQRKFTDIITTQIEHPSVIEAALLYHKTSTNFIKLLSDGSVDLDDLEYLLKTKTRTNRRILVSVQFANQVIHTIQPIEQISELCKKYGAKLHVDATQAFGKISLLPFDIDFITISAHKCYGPKGIAGIWISENEFDQSLIPMLAGGHQEYNLRAGTHNVPGIIGFKTAAEYMCSKYQEHENKVQSLSSLFYMTFMDRLPDSILNGNRTNRLAGGFHFSVPGVDMRAILLSIPDLIISTGMSCSSSESDPVMKALGELDKTRNSFRIQIGFENTEEEITIASNLLTDAIINTLSFWGKL